jgi:hypothetical protein
LNISTQAGELLPDNRQTTRIDTLGTERWHLPQKAALRHQLDHAAASENRGSKRDRAWPLLQPALWQRQQLT